MTRRAAANLWSAAAVIVVADAAMGLDNVVALAAIARGNFWLLAIGVAFSLPILGYGGMMLHELLRRAPGLLAFGAALLGWVAGGMAISESRDRVLGERQRAGSRRHRAGSRRGFRWLHGRIAASEVATRENLLRAGRADICRPA